MSSISNPEIKKLYGLSAGRCNICKTGVFDNHVHVGEMAHIIAKSTKGPRGEESLSCGRNSYDNLILLCANHHLEVDQNSEFYTVEKLHQIKAEHEQNIASLFEAPKEREKDIIFINTFMRYVPFTRLPSFLEYLPTSVKLDLCYIGDMFEALYQHNPHLYPLNDQNLQQYFGNYLTSYYNLWAVISGETFVNGREQANFSQADDRLYIHMEKKYLPYEEVSKLSGQLNTLSSSLMDSYMQLMNYLRSHYKEVDLNSYEPL